MTYDDWKLMTPDDELVERDYLTRRLIRRLGLDRDPDDAREGQQDRGLWGEDQE